MIGIPIAARAADGEQMAKKIVNPEPPNYPKELLQPIYVPNLLSLAGRNAAGALTEFVKHQREAKLDILCKHYNIDLDKPERWHQLAMELAIDHVTGFLWTHERPPSDLRPTEGEMRALRERARLVGDVEAHCLRTGDTIPDAIKALTQDENSRWFNKHAPTLETRHKEGRSIANKRAAMRKRTVVGAAEIGPEKTARKSVRTKRKD
jgi:hypothetical protein